MPKVWTVPRTWVAGELVTASLMNQHVRDNMEYLLPDIPTEVFVASLAFTSAITPGFSVVTGSAIVKVAPVACRARVRVVAQVTGLANSQQIRMDYTLNSVRQGGVAPNPGWMTRCFGATTAVAGLSYYVGFEHVVAAAAGSNTFELVVHSQQAGVACTLFDIRHIVEYLYT